MTISAALINQSSIVSRSIEGNGRSFVLVVEAGSEFEVRAEQLAKQLLDLGQICILKVYLLDDWRKGVEELLEFFDSSGIRTASFIALGDASVLVQAICLKKVRLIRTLVFVDGATRAHASRFVKFIDRVEGYLPLGLPFRSDFPGFDGKPFLQRIRCPVLIVLSPLASEYRKEQAKLLVEGMPTSFLVDFNNDNFDQGLISAIKDFQEVPAKSPQKNLR